MSWGLVAGAVIGGVVSYAGQKSSNSANAKLAKQQGYVDTTTTRNPYEPASPYLDAGAQAAYQALFGRAPDGKEPGPAILGDPRAAGGGGAAKPPAGYRTNKAGKVVPIRNPASGAAAPTAAAGAAPTGKKFDGQSQETLNLINRLSGLDKENEPMYDAGERYSTGLLNGTTTNPLMGRAAGAADAISNDPGLEDYINALRGGVSGGGSPGSSSGGRARVRQDGTIVGGGGAGGNGAYSPATQGYGSSTGVEAAIRDMIAGKDAPGLAAQSDAIARQVAEKRADQVRQLRARAVGSGFYGGDMYKELEEGAIAQGDQELADSLAAARFGAYQHALDLGAQWDLGQADLASRERSAAASASASAAALSQQNDLARLGMWGDALQLGQQGRAGTAASLGDLAKLFSADQQGALQGIGMLGDSRRGDLSAAGQLSLGSDQARNSFIGNANQLRAAQIAGGNQRAELAFERERFYDPFSRLSAYTSVLGGLYGGLGSETTTGRDTRAAGGTVAGNPWGAALQGAAMGGQIGAAYQPRARTSGYPANGVVGNNPGATGPQAGWMG